MLKSFPLLICYTAMEAMAHEHRFSQQQKTNWKDPAFSGKTSRQNSGQISRALAGDSEEAWAAAAPWRN